MASRWKGLADRLRAAASTQRSHDEVATRDQKRIEVESRSARESLYKELEAFASATGLTEHRRVDGELQLRVGPLSVSFRHIDSEGRIELTWTEQRDGEAIELYREQALGNRWIWVHRFRGKETRLPLFDKGLEVLMVSCLGLPDPEPEQAASQTPEDPNPSTVGRKRTL